MSAGVCEQDIAELALLFLPRWLTGIGRKGGEGKEGDVPALKIYGMWFFGRLDPAAVSRLYYLLPYSILALHPPPLLARHRKIHFPLN